MRTVDANELEASLSAYLARAQADETIVTRDRDAPIAKLIPFAQDDGPAILPALARTDADFTEEELALAAQGVLTLPRQRMDWEAFWQMPRPKVNGNALTQALLAEREEGR